MFQSNVPKHFWGEAILTTTFLINHMPSRVIGFLTPIHVFSQVFPHNRLVYEIPLRVFGCTSFVHVYSQNITKLDPRALKTFFLGYSPTQKGYKCYDPLTRKMYVSYDVSFFENQPYFSKTSIQGENLGESRFLEIVYNSLPPIESSPNLNPMPLVDVEPEKEKTQQTVPELRVYSRRQHHQQDTGQAPSSSIASSLEPSLNPAPNLNNSSKDHPEIDRTDLSLNPAPNPNSSSSDQPENNESEIGSSQNHQIQELDLPIAQRKGVRSGTHCPSERFASYNALSQPYGAFLSNLSKVNLPRSIEEAMKISDWREAVFEEMKALKKNGTWEICSLPKGVVPVGCKWVFTVKHKSDGIVERFKA